MDFIWVKGVCSGKWRKKYNITVGNETKEFEEGTTYQAVAKSSAVVFSSCRSCSGRRKQTAGTKKTVEKDCELKFITTADAIGHETYKEVCAFFL